MSIELHRHGHIQEIRLARPPVNALTPELLAALRTAVKAAPSEGARGIILTGGATFSTIISKTGDSSTLSTPHVQVADTVGAGDSFSGAFAAKILTGASLEEAHRTAVNTAAFVCTNDGAWPEYPEQVPDYLAEAGL